MRRMQRSYRPMIGSLNEFFQKKEELPSVWHSFALWNERFEWMREAMPIEIPLKPDWLVQKPEDRLHEWYDRLPVVFENGRIVLGHIVQANDRRKQAPV